MYFEEPNFVFPPHALIEYHKYRNLADKYWYKTKHARNVEWNSKRWRNSKEKGIALWKLMKSRSGNKWQKKWSKCAWRAIRIAEIWNRRMEILNGEKL
jgi:hypothetical protein